MNVGNSDLFKSFARPTLQHHYGQGDTDPPQQTGIMNSIIQYLLNRSRLEVSLIRITEATEDSYVVAIESRVTGTGPVSSTVSAMELELTYNGSCIGKVNLPELKTSIWGAKVHIQEQRVPILDMAAYKLFVRSIMMDEETCFQLENGRCTIKSLDILAHCDYCLDIPIRGMMGPQFTFQKVEREGDGVTMVVKIQNPSPVEIDHGVGIFELRNSKGDVVMELKGILKIVRGVFDVTLHGKAIKGAEMTDKARLVGMGVEGDSWCGQTIRFLDVVADVTPEVSALVQS